MRSAFTLLTIVLATTVCHAQQKAAPPPQPVTAPVSKPAPVRAPASKPAPPRSPAAPIQTADRAAILADSEVRYSESGGIAGYMTNAVLKTDNGSTNVEYLPPQSRPSTPALTGTLTDAEYLDLWKTLEGANIWSLSPTQQRPYPDMIRHELMVRIGDRSHQIVWLEADASPAVQTAAKLAEAVRKSAEQAALLR